MLEKKYEVFKFKDLRGFEIKEVVDSIIEEFKKRREIVFFVRYADLNVEIFVDEIDWDDETFRIYATFEEDGECYTLGNVFPDGLIEIDEAIKVIREEIEKDQEMFFRQLRFVRFETGSEKVFFFNTEINNEAIKKVLKRRAQLAIEAMVEGDSYNDFFTDLMGFGPSELIEAISNEEEQAFDIDDIYYKE